MVIRIFYHSYVPFQREVTSWASYSWHGNYICIFFFKNNLWPMLVTFFLWKKKKNYGYKSTPLIAQELTVRIWTLLKAEHNLIRYQKVPAGRDDVSFTAVGVNGEIRLSFQNAVHQPCAVSIDWVICVCRCHLGDWCACGQRRMQGERQSTSVDQSYSPGDIPKKQQKKKKHQATWNSII